MTTQEKIKIIEESYNALHVLNSLDFRLTREALHDANKKEEKAHRKWISKIDQERTRKAYSTFPLSFATKFWTVKNIQKAIEMRTPKFKDLYYLCNAYILSQMTLSVFGKAKAKRLLKHYEQIKEIEHDHFQVDTFYSDRNSIKRNGG